MPDTKIVDYLLTLDETLKATYNIYQDLLYYSKRNDYNRFKDYVLGYSKENKLISSFMVTSIQTLSKHLPRIANTFRYSFSNGSLEGSVNKIKVIKRVAYGYRNFRNFRCWILISFKSTKKDTKKTAKVFLLSLPKTDFILTKFSSSTSFNEEPF